MTAGLHAELLKLRTTRTFVALSAAAIATSVLLTGLVAFLTEPTAASVLDDVFASDTSGLFVMVLAVVGITGEWRHRTITSALLAAPHRLRFLAAKTLAYAAAGLLLSLVVSVAIAVTGYAVLLVRGLPTPEAGELLGLVARNATVSALTGAFGVGIGAIARNQVVAVVGVLLAAFAIEPAVLALAPDVGRFGPFVALPTAVLGQADDAGLGSLELFAPMAAAGLWLAWIGSAFAAGAAPLRIRDLD